MSKEEKIRWRLGQLPSVEDIRGLVEDKIITSEEAREILFSKETEDIQSLKKEVEVLRKVVQQQQPMYIDPFRNQLQRFDFWTHFFN